MTSRSPAVSYGASAKEHAKKNLNSRLANRYEIKEDELERFQAFQEKYRYDPRSFVEDCVEFPNDGELAPYQSEILDLLMRDKRVAVRGPHGLGKTVLAALLVLWASLVSINCKVPTTASAWIQLQKYLWPEIRLWAKRLRWDIIGREPFKLRELMTLSLRVESDQGITEAFAITSDEHHRIEGAHADRMLIIFDEAKAIPFSTWDALEGAFSNAGPDTGYEAYAFAISTPGIPSGRFYEIHARRKGYEDWKVRHVKLEEAIAAGRIDREWAEQRKRQWGEDTAVYLNRVLGEFAASDSTNVAIPLPWIEAANERWREWKESGNALPDVDPVVGVDPGGGNAVTAIAPRYENIVSDMHILRGKNSTAYIAGIVATYIKGGRGVIDVGWNPGVYDELRNLGKNVTSFHSSHRSHERDSTGELGFYDRRSAAYWNLREKLNPENNENIMLPPNDTLIGDLAAPTWGMTSGGKIKVESKKDIKKRIGRSTDFGDAVVYSFEQNRSIKLVLI
jgi:hypothetical protein